MDAHVPRTPPQPPELARLFIGLWPTPGLRQAVQAQLPAWQWPEGARPTHPSRLHLTVHFLGHLPRAWIPDLAAGLAVESPAFELMLDRAEAWRNHVAVLRPAATPPVLAALHEALADRLRSLRLPVDERFTPHLTVARAAHGAVPPASPEPLHWPVSSYVLIDSELGPRARYHLVQTYPLA